MAKALSIGNISTSFNTTIYTTGTTSSRDGNLILNCTGAIGDINFIKFMNKNDATNWWRINSGGGGSLGDLGQNQNYTFALQTNDSIIFQIDTSGSLSTHIGEGTGMYTDATTAYTFFGAGTSATNSNSARMVYRGETDGSNYNSALEICGDSVYIDFHVSNSITDDYHSRLLDTGSGLTATGTVSTWSDRRVKENIKIMEDNTLYTNLLKELQPKEYNYINAKNKPMKYGFIAQEVEEVLNKYNIGPENNERYPLVILPDKADDMYSLDYNSIITLLWKIVQNQEEQIETCQIKINNIKEKINELKGEN